MCMINTSRVGSLKFNIFLKFFSIIFYTDGSNPIINNSHVDYFRNRKINFIRVQYFIFPASHFFYFWWQRLVSSDILIFDKVDTTTITESYKMLIDHYKEIGDTFVERKLFTNVDSIALVMLRDFYLFNDSDENHSFEIVSHLLSRINKNKTVIIKHDSRMLPMKSQKIVHLLKSYNYEVYEIDGRYDNIPIEVFLPSLVSIGTRKIQFITFGGSLIFNVFLFINLFCEISVNYEYPDKIWNMMNSYQRKIFMVKLTTAKKLSRLIVEGNYSENKGPCGSTFMFKDNHTISLQ